MKLEYLPLLQVQRELYAIPRGRERFEAYLAAMTDSLTGDLKLPLSAMNPMGKEHVPALLDQYIALGVDDLAGRAVRDAEMALDSLPGAFRVCLVIADDLMGGWTNRHAAEFNHRFETQAMFKRGWLVGVIWTSEPARAEVVVREAVTTAYRGAWILHRGHAQTLRDMLAQEGYAMARAGCSEPTLDPDDLTFTREVITPHLGATDRATVMACVFGDAAARALGYPPEGLSERAGLALALFDARGTAGEHPLSQLSQ